MRLPVMNNGMSQRHYIFATHRWSALERARPSTGSQKQLGDTDFLLRCDTSINIY